jgi:hypothetical protein
MNDTMPAPRCAHGGRDAHSYPAGHVLEPDNASGVVRLHSSGDQDVFANTLEEALA